MRILVTGATGFIGNKVVKKLSDDKENDLIVLSSKNIDGIKTVDSKSYNFTEDYLLNNDCADVDVLLHIGAFTPKAGKEANDIRRSIGNIKSTEALLRGLKHVGKIIFISTIDVYGSADEVITEKTNTIPMTMYGWSKLFCEQMIINYSKSKDIQYEILRLGHVYGEGEEVYKKVMPVMIQNAVNGEDINIYGDGKAIRTYIYIDDVVKAIVKSLNLTESEIINMVGNEQITINELAELIRTLADNKIEINHERTNVRNVNYVFDNSKLMNLLLDSLVPIQIGLKNEFEYMRKLK